MVTLMTGTVQHYAWGSPTMIPNLLGAPVTGEPHAELWLGAHPLAPSLVDGRPLDVLVDEDPEAIVGTASITAFGPRLPFLVKVLAAVQPLSLQAHPSREQAEAGFAREQAAGIPRDAPHRIYRDSWPKPEILCALEPTEALCGFRDPAETYELFGRLGVPAAVDLVSCLADRSVPAARRLADVFGSLLRLRDGHVLGEVTAAARSCTADGDLGLFATTARELHDFFPGDPGILAALLMNRVDLRQYDAVFLPAGNLHAYLRGGGIEVMANSDNVMRGGLTPKYVDVDELLHVLDFRPGFVGLVPPVEEARGVWRYPTPAPEFAVWRLDGREDGLDVPGVGGGRVLIVTEGTPTIVAGDARLRLGPGASVLIRATEHATLFGTGVAFVGAPGV